MGQQRGSVLQFDMELSMLFNEAVALIGGIVQELEFSRVAVSL